MRRVSDTIRAYEEYAAAEIMAEIKARADREEKYAQQCAAISAAHQKRLADDVQEREEFLRRHGRNLTSADFLGYPKQEQ